MKLEPLKKLHDKGMALLWLRPKSKRPFEKDWTRTAPKEWAELENSFEPTYNVGVRLGEPSRLVSGMYLGAIDCDVKSKSRKALTEMNDKLRELGLDLSVAPVVMSGRGNGSKHIYVQTKEPMRPVRYAKSTHQVKVLMPGEARPHSKKEMEELTDAERKQGYRIRPAWEISFMGTGQQTVLPPSIHPDTGFAYTWASPLTVKHVPVFKPMGHVEPGAGETSRAAVEGLDFVAEDVDLYESKLNLSIIKGIETGRGVEDRSAYLMTASMAMCRAGFTDNQILSVLTDEANWLSEAAYDHTQGRSRSRAVKWLYKYTVLKARFNTDVMRYFDNPPEFATVTPSDAAATVGEIEADVAQRFPDVDGSGKPKATLRNMVHLFEQFWGGGLIGFNQFNNRPYFLKDTPYGGTQGRELVDNDDLNLKHYVATHYRFEPSKELCFETHTLIAHRYGFHPVREYLNGLKWDGVPRLNGWLKCAMGAVGPKAYLESVARKVLVAAVARIFEPGCKFDYVLVLEGNQGEGKSSALGILAGATWFTDSLGDIHQKDVVDQMMGKWLIEMGELASIRKAEVESTKAFISRQVDRVRLPYGRRSEDFPRQSIFIGSTNAKEYLTDETGNRRYWPVAVGTIDREWLRVNRNQLWAEAVIRYELGEDVWFNQEVEAIARKEQEHRYEVDEWESQIRKIVTKDPGGVFITTELWRAVNLTSGNGHPPMYDTKRIGKIMHRLGYGRHVRRFEGVNAKCWVKE